VMFVLLTFALELLSPYEIGCCFVPNTLGRCGLQGTMWYHWGGLGCASKGLLQIGIQQTRANMKELAGSLGHVG
jgi:hypothetical protein